MSTTTLSYDELKQEILQQLQENRFGFLKTFEKLIPEVYENYRDCFKIFKPSGTNL